MNTKENVQPEEKIILKAGESITREQIGQIMRASIRAANEIAYRITESARKKYEGVEYLGRTS